MGLFEAADGWWWMGLRDPPPQNLLYISHNDETWHSYTVSKEDPNKL